MCEALRAVGETRRGDVALALALLIVGFPALAILACRRWTLLARLSPVVLCYAAGIVVGNLGVMTTGAAEVADLATAATVALAIPLLLFGADLRRWARLARPTMISFGLAVVAIVVTAIVASFVFGDVGGAGPEVAGMTVGVYTGGTANMGAIGRALQVPEATFVALNAADVLLGAIYLLVLLTVAKRVLSTFLPAFRYPSGGGEATGAGEPHAQDPWSYRPPVAAIARGLGAAVVVLAIGAAASFALVTLVADPQGAVLDHDGFASGVILAVTTLAIAASFWRPVHAIPGTYEVGQYLFLMFAVAIGTLAEFGELVASLGTVFPYLTAALVGAILLHLAMAAAFRIDTDTAIITSTAAVFGPPFVGPVAAAINNREIVVSGLTTGVVGLALGNYAGLAVAYLLR
jgi:uncharacterized membrane protein